MPSYAVSFANCSWKGWGFICLFFSYKDEFLQCLNSVTIANQDKKDFTSPISSILQTHARTISVYFRVQMGLFKCYFFIAIFATDSLTIQNLN